MKLSTFSTFALILSILSGCASQPSVPDWIAGNSAKYKSEQYLIGRGQSAKLEEAKDRARADIAKVFQVAVVVSSEDVQRFKSGSSGPAQYEEEASRYISTSTDQIISGIQIAELWQDPANGSYHVLAILPRLQAAASLRQQIGEHDDATRNYIDQSRKETDAFMKIAAATQALQSQLERGTLQKNLQVVDVTGRGIESQWSIAKLKSDLDELVKRVSIAPRVAADAPAGLAEMIGGALAQVGFVLDTSDHPQFVLQAKMSLTDLGLVDGWYWMRGSIEVTLTETAADNRVRGTMHWGVRGNASNKDAAIRRAKDQADTVLKRELGPSIINMAVAK